MFSLASHKLLGRRILVIADEADTALVLTDAIGGEGGVALGPTATIEEALSYVSSIGKVDCVMLETRMAISARRLIPPLFADHGVETVMVTGHDEWFEEDDDDGEKYWPETGLLLANA